MASGLLNSISGIPQPGQSRLRGAPVKMNYQAGQAVVQPQRPSWVEALGNMAQAGADVYKAIDSKQQEDADARSNEIIRKLTPEQRREALNNGTLLYQDDPYAMQQLRIKTGRNGAFKVDDEVAQKIKNGEYRTREDMEKDRNEKLQAGAKEWADSFGIKEDDPDYQAGYNSNITERNISLYNAHDTFLSDQAQKGAILNSKVELNSVLSDSSMLARPESGVFFSKYIDDGLKTGAIPSDAQAAQIITGSINDVVQRPGSAAFLQSLEGKTVTLNGTTTTYKQLMGDEQWNALMVKAQHSQFQNDAKLTESFRLNISSATNQADISTGWEMLQAAKEQLDKVQPGQEMTPEREQLIAAQEQLQGRFRSESAALATEMDKQQKTMNKQSVIDRQFDKRLNGEYVSTSYKDMPTNTNTGEFTHSDMVNYANNKLAQIEAMKLSDQQKDKLKLDYLRADNKDGAFRTAVGELVTDAGQEWSAGVINGKLPENTPALQALRRLRNSDPNLVAALYPEQADLFLTMDMMDKQGIDPQVLVDADRSRRSLTKEMQLEDDRAWVALKNNSAEGGKDISRIPASLDGMARKIYDSFKYRTGNSDGAMQQVHKFLLESTTTFTGDDLDGSTIGIIPKNVLQVNDDPASWEQGKNILDEARKGIIAANPWVTNKQLSMYQQGDSVWLMDTTGTIRIRYDRELLSRAWQDQQQKLDEANKAKALKAATERAPIAEVNKVSKEIKEGKRKGIAQRSQEFRESRLNGKQKDNQ
ncbi:internal virion protein C [Pectobacterium phage Q19]|uniref:Internal virion protein gp15 n=1 Tax=Pectobacterium phage Q19 TaxID=2500576 RepID=A0A678ZKG1_9CAUD|nr:internal virion protein C [Pectobacterium phage Q19]